jgi:dolichol-phosphate mannosyltransferase
MSRDGRTVSQEDSAPTGTTVLATRVVRAGESPDLSVVIPTRNEAGNIQLLLARLQDALSDIAAEVLVVDDSDDATPEIARQAAMRSALSVRVFVRRPGRRPGGLGGAVLVGLSEAAGPVCVVMDADLQHPPELLKTLFRVSRTGADFVIASRYVDGGEDQGLGGWYRRAVSGLATWAAKWVLRPELAGISDPMSGFFLVRRSSLDLRSLHPQGFKLLLELLVHHPRASVAEVPFTFDSRHSGVSKAGIREGLIYLNRLAKLGIQARRARPRRRRRLVTATRGTNGNGLSAGLKFTSTTSAPGRGIG